MDSVSYLNYMFVSCLPWNWYFVLF